MADEIKVDGQRARGGCVVSEGRERQPNAQ